MARVVVAAPYGLTRPHGQHGLAAIERLDLGLLVHTQDDGMLGRGDIEAVSSVDEYSPIVGIENSLVGIPA